MCAYTTVPERVQIQRLTPTKNGRASVVVHMREKAHVVARGRTEDAYHRNVMLEYHFQRTGSGWMLVGSQDVTRTAGKVGA